MLTALFNTVILVLLGLIHFYWLFGGKWGVAVAVPEKNGKKVLAPSLIATLIVAGGLIGFGVFHLYKIGWLSMTLPTWLDQYGLWIIASIFFLRVVGDFRYVGLFKRVKHSQFAKWDTKLFIPLCLFISLNALITALSIN